MVIEARRASLGCAPSVLEFGRKHEADEGRRRPANGFRRDLEMLGAVKKTGNGERRVSLGEPLSAGSSRPPLGPRRKKAPRTLKLMRQRSDSMPDLTATRDAFGDFGDPGESESRRTALSRAASAGKSFEQVGYELVTVRCRAQGGLVCSVDPNNAKSSALRLIQTSESDSLAELGCVFELVWLDGMSVDGARIALRSLTNGKFVTYNGLRIFSAFKPLFAEAKESNDWEQFILHTVPDQTCGGLFIKHGDGDYVMATKSKEGAHYNLVLANESEARQPVRSHEASVIFDIELFVNERNDEESKEQQAEQDESMEQMKVTNADSALLVTYASTLCLFIAMLFGNGPLLVVALSGGGGAFMMQQRSVAPTQSVSTSSDDSGTIAKEGADDEQVPPDMEPVDIWGQSKLWSPWFTHYEEVLFPFSSQNFHANFFADQAKLMPIDDCIPDPNRKIGPWQEERGWQHREIFFTGPLDIRFKEIQRVRIFDSGVDLRTECGPISSPASGAVSHLSRWHIRDSHGGCSLTLQSAISKLKGLPMLVSGVVRTGAIKGSKESAELWMRKAKAALQAAEARRP